MLLAAGHNWRPDRGPGRWIGAAFATVVLHGGAVAAGLITWQSVTPPVLPPAAIMMELMPVPVAPPAPEVEAAQESRLPDPEPMPLKESEPEPEPLPEPVVEVPLPAPPPIEEVPLALQTPEVTLPKPVPEKPKPVEQLPQDQPKEKPKKVADKPKEKPQDKPQDKPQEKPKAVAKKDVEEQVQPQKTPPAQAASAAQAPSAPVQPAEVAAAPSAADRARIAHAEANWQGLVMAHLEKFKRYPKSAQRRNIQGSPFLRVRLDRSGNVLSFSLERSSGHEALDEEVLALAERAAPLPAMPPEMPGPTIDLVVPVDFYLNR